jgi:hypothetical protein
VPPTNPTPRRGAGSGRPSGSGRSGAPGSGGGSSQGTGSRGGGGKSSNPSRRPRPDEGVNGSARSPREGAERRIDRAGSDAPRGGRSRPPRDENRRSTEGQYERRDDDSRERRDARPNEERRPRPASAGRGGRDGRPSARPTSRDARPSYPRRPESDVRRSPRSPDRYERDDRPRPASAGRAGRDDRPARDSRFERSSNSRPSRPSRDDAYSDRRPSLPPRSVRPGARDGARDERPRRDGARRPDRRARELTPEEIEKAKADSYGRGKGWGGVARKGGANLKSTGQAMEVTPSTGKTPDPLSKWVEEVRPAKPAPPASVKVKAKYALPGDVAAEVRRAFIGTSYMREKMVMTLTRAAEAYDRKRYEEALRLGRIVSDAVPGVAPVRELTGLAAYRADRWSMAKIHLRAHFTITGDPEHLPLVMDCDRANKRYRAVEKTFAEIEENEPTAEVVVEGRIVMASTLADQRMYKEAIDLLTKAGATKQLRNPSFRHVRLWYALADIFDRAGDTASARELFARIVVAEPDAYDAQSRLGDLGATTPSKNRKRRTVSVSKKKVD